MRAYERLVRRVDGRDARGTRREATRLTAARVSFARRTDAAVQTYWIDYDGRLRPYSTIASGETFDQGTYETHPWTFTTKASSRNGKAKSERRRCVVNDSPIYVVSGEEDVSDGSLNDREKKARVVEIRRPRVVDWSPDVHEAFSIGFKRAVRCFLLAHQRSRSTSADKGLGTMPNDMLLEIIARMAPMKRVYREIGA